MEMTSIVVSTISGKTWDSAFRFDIVLPNLRKCQAKMKLKLPPMMRFISRVATDNGPGGVRNSKPCGIYDLLEHLPGNFDSVKPV